MTVETAATAGKRLAQFPLPGGVNPTLSDPADGEVAVGQAIDRFSQDKPITSVTDYTILANTFRVVLAGTGAVLTGGAAWVDGKSSIVELFYPWASTEQNPPAIDGNSFRLERGASSSIVLAFRSYTLQAGQVLRLVTSGPHADDCSTVPAGYARGFEALVAHFLLTLAANRAAQNTGNTGFATDVVDRRSQAGEFYLRAKNMLAIYSSAVGLAVTDAPIGAISGFKDLDVSASHPGGFLWHPGSRR